MLYSCCGEDTRNIDQMPTSILHFLAISNDLCTHPRLSCFHVFDDGQDCSVRRPFQLLAVLQHHCLIVVVIPVPLEAVPCLCLFTGLLFCSYNTSSDAGCWLLPSLIPVPLVVGIAPAAVLQTPQHHQGSSGF